MILDPSWDWICRILIHQLRCPDLYLCQRQPQDHLSHSHHLWEGIQCGNTQLQTTIQQLITIPCLIEAMGWAQWLKEQNLMISHFWDNILDHPHCFSSLPDDKQALMVYQEEQHKQWHHATSISGQGYDPSEINEALLLVESTQDSLLWEHHWKDDKVYKASVSTFPSPFHHENYYLTITLPKILHH